VNGKSFSTAFGYYFTNGSIIVKDNYFDAATYGSVNSTLSDTNITKYPAFIGNLYPNATCYPQSVIDGTVLTPDERISIYNGTTETGATQTLSLSAAKITIGHYLRVTHNAANTVYKFAASNANFKIAQDIILASSGDWVEFRFNGSKWELAARSTELAYLTTTARNGIPTPSAGLRIYNTSTNQMNYYNGTAWIAF
jgi:hypothetical protein